MATPLSLRGYRCFSPRNIFSKPSTTRILARLLILLVAATLLSTAARAQFTQPLVFSSGGAVLLRNDQTGALTPVLGSPFPATGETLTLDVQGRYLFGIAANSIDLYAVIDSSTGAYQKVAHSPFSSSNTKQPLFIAVEPTGKFIAVVSAQGQNPGEAAIETFQISPTASGGPALVPVPGSFLELDSTIVGVSQPASSASAFYLYLGPQFPSVPTVPEGDEFDIVTIDPLTGLLSGISSGNITSSAARAYASDPQGRYVVTARGKLVGQIELIGIDGKFPGAGVTLPEGEFPSQVWVDSTGTFLYATYAAAHNPPVHIYSLNLQTYALLETASSPLPNATAVPSYQPDPTGPFNYDPQYNTTLSQIAAFTVDPATGYFVPAPISPLTVPGIGQLTFSIVPGSQGISGPAIQIVPAALSLGTLQIGTPSAPQMIMLTSDGAEALSINSIAVGGADPGEFLESDTCQPPAVLQPKKFCSISITFNPSASGPQSATLLITSNAPGSPHSVPLSGAGVAPPPPAPVVTVNPNPATFPTITQGTISNPMNITLTNTGNAALHISSVVVGGNNPGDFTNAPSNCSAATLAANAACTFAVTFAPLAAGQRTETITVSDDAANSPQIITVSGSATPAIAASGATTASVSPGVTAQYQLQITPGANYTGVISMTCSGTPVGATCQLPASVSVSNGNPAPLTVMITTSGAALAPPGSLRPWNTPAPVHYRPLSLLLLASVLGLFLLLVPGRAIDFQHAAIHRRLRMKIVAVGACATLAFLTLALFAAGCGGGSSTAPPAPLVTPQGTSTITIMPSAKSASGQALQLAPIQLTLTVN